MKRSKALAALSRDHHEALVVAQKLRRATAATACDARDAFLAAYWTGHGREHFRLEEELLFPAYAGYGDPHDPLVLRALGQHVMLRHRAAALADGGTALPGSLEQLGAELAAHVRLEEREVFPLMERVMPTHELEAVARQLESAKRA
jgi:hypothetical protein